MTTENKMSTLGFEKGLFLDTFLRGGQRGGQKSGHFCPEKYEQYQ